MTCDMPLDPALPMPKIMVTLFDSDPSPLGLSLLGKSADFLAASQPIGRALAPAGDFSKTVKEYYNRPAHLIQPTWLNLYSPLEAELDFEPATDPAAMALLPPTCGKLLCSFDLRPSREGLGRDEKHDQRSQTHGKGGKADAEASAAGEGSSSSSSGSAGGAGSLKPPTKPYLIEISVVGCRDMQPREILGVPIHLQVRSEREAAVAVDVEASGSWQHRPIGDHNLRLCGVVLLVLAPHLASPNPTSPHLASPRLTSPHITSRLTSRRRTSSLNTASRLSHSTHAHGARAPPPSTPTPPPPPPC